MNPTDTQLDNRITAVNNINNGVEQSTNTIAPEDFSTTKPISVVGARPSSIPNLDSLTAKYSNTLTATNSSYENEANSLVNSIKDNTNALTGQAFYTGEQEQLAGIDEIDQRRNDVQNQLNLLNAERSAIPLAFQEEYAGRNATKGAVAPLLDADLRRNAIATLSTSASLDALNGDLATAQAKVDRAVAVEFDPIREEIAAQRANLELILPMIEREDTQRRQALTLAFEERNRLIEKEELEISKREAERKSVGNLAIQASQYGADSETVSNILNSKSFDEAILSAGQSLRDPVAIQALANAKLDNDLTKLRIQREQYDLYLLDKYGGLSPTQYHNQLKEEQAFIAAATDEQEKAMRQGEALQEKLGIFDNILASSGLDTVVGPTFLTRGIARQKEGFFGKTLSLVKNVATIGTTSGVIDEVTGSADKVVDLTEQLISTEFLDNLISVKERGGTFGALQKAEQDALTNAATSIGNSRICEGGKCIDGAKVIGYDMSESEFRRQISILQEKARVAYERSTGNSFTPEEQAELDAYEDSVNLFNSALSTSAFNPSF